MAASGIVGCIGDRDEVMSGRDDPEGRPMAAVSQSGTSDPVARAVFGHADAGRWDQIHAMVPRLLINVPENDTVLRLAIRASLERRDLDSTAALATILAGRMDLSDAGTVAEMLSVLLTVGRLDDALDLLVRALKVHPGRDDWRRLVIDSRWMLEDHAEGRRVARAAVRRRKFDQDLLLSMLPLPRRELEDETLARFAEVNPTDRRLTIPAARRAFDAGDFDRTRSIAETILRSHPDFVPAWVLWLRAASAAGVTAGDLDEPMRRRLDRAAGRVETALSADNETRAAETASGWESPEFLASLASFVRQTSGEGDRADLASLYRHAATRYPVLREAWEGLAATSDDAAEVAAAVKNLRVINRYDQALTRLLRKIGSPAAARVDIGRALGELGLPYLAEAWLSLAESMYGDERPGGAIGDEAAPGSASPGQPTPPIESIRQHRRRWIAAIREEAAWADVPLHRSNVPGGESDGGGPVRWVEAAARLARSAAAGGDGGPRGGGARLVTATRTPAAFRLVDVAAEVGLRHDALPADDLDQPGVPISHTLGCGGAAVDYDRDGWPDVYLADGGGRPMHRDNDPNPLYRNLGGRFVDVGAAAGVGYRGFGIGVTYGDLNADGFDDLVATGYGGDRVYLNRGDGTFADASKRFFHGGKTLPGGGVEPWSTSAAIADLDGDALADLFVLKYCRGEKPITVQCWSGEVLRSCAPVFFPAAADWFRSNPDAVADAPPAVRWDDAVDVGRGLGILVGELAPAAGNDVFVANDMTANHLWSVGPGGGGGGGGGVRRESAVAAGLAGGSDNPNQGSMGIAHADANGDGRADLLVTNFYGESNALHLSEPSTTPDRAVRMGLRNSSRPLVGFGTQAVDLDGDGVTEWAVANGSIDAPGEGVKSEAYEQPFQILAPDGPAALRPVPPDRIGPAGGYVARPHVGRAVWTCDFDRDHRTDLMVTHQTEPVAVLRNETAPAGGFLELTLVGTDAVERDAVGAVVEVVTGGVRRVGFVTAGDGYLCRNERTLRFGVPAGESSAVVTIRWGDGTSRSWDVGAGRCYVCLPGRRPWMIE